MHQRVHSKYDEKILAHNFYYYYYLGHGKFTFILQGADTMLVMEASS